MSKPHRETIACPHCKASSDFTVWDSVNTMIDPELKDKVINGQLFEWTCPSCGYKATVDYRILYHEMEKQAMIFFVPGDPQDAIMELEEVFHNIEKDFSVGQNYRIRVVSSINQLREKAMILEASLDDRLIEIMKAFMIAHMKDNRMSELLFEMTQKGEKRFAARNNKDKWGIIEFQQSLYDKTSEVFMPKFENSGKNDYIVNLDWAIETIKADQNS